MPTYTPVNKTYSIWNKDPVNSVDINNFTFVDNANVAHNITYSADWSAGAGAEWSPGVPFTGNQTLISKTKTYVSHVGNIYVATSSTNYFKGQTPFTRAYTTSTGDKLQVASTTTPVPITVGMAVTGGGFSGQTVTAFSATVGWMVLSAVGPGTLPAVGTSLTFTDPYPPTLKLVSTATLYTGMTINGNGFTTGQTIVSIGTDTTIVASANPDTGVYANAIVEFNPPQYVLQVNNITGLDTGWYVDTDGSGVYTAARTVVSTSGTQYLIMSGDVGYVSPSGSVKFISNVNKMITLAPNTSATWVLYYEANNATVSNNLASITISATQQGNVVQKEIVNLVSINQAPSTSNIQPPVDPTGGGGGGGAGYTVTSETVTFSSDLDAGYDIASTMTTTTVTDNNGNVVSVTVSSTDAVSFSGNAATDGVAQAAAAIGTNAATASSVAAAIADAQAAVDAAQADADAAQADADAADVGNVDGTADTGVVGESTTSDTGGEGPSPSSNGGGCCFIMLEARYGDGTMDLVVRRYRDENMTDRNRRGYYKVAEVFVPLMRDSRVFKYLITKTFADPLVCYGKYHYGENRWGWVFKPVERFWMRVFNLVGNDTKFIRENGEVV